MGWDELVDEAYSYLMAEMDKLIDVFSLGDYEEYLLDQETATIQFFKDGVAEIEADIQVVGTLSHETHTWLWSTENESIHPNAKQAIPDIIDFGKQAQYEPMMNAKWPAEEDDGWVMVAIAAYLLKAQGGYRAESEKAFVYVTLNQIRRI